MAMIQHYFVAAWIPPPEESHHFYTKALPGPRYAVGVMTPTATAAPGDSVILQQRLYVGPKEHDRLAQAAPGLQLTVDYGILTIIADPLFWLLRLLHGWLGNWGWAIVVLTILIKLAFFQLSATSYKSMAHMRRLQPRLQALKERYGDDRAKLNQAMMDMYKKERINPLGGCLPILVQIPVFIALYWVLLETVELRQAPFLLWIRDLSTYDPYFVLPLLMGATMFIQQKLTPSPLDPIQQKVMLALPVVFTAMFLFFPAGLVLYWFVNNALSIAQQWVITKRYENAPA
jgi:YidC/Oxa1 family membrane protein insertase